MRSPRTKFEIRRNRVRAKIAKVSDRLRLSVFKSSKHIYVQLIDDVAAVTLASASTLDKATRKIGKSNCNLASAQLVGESIASKAAALGITKVVFDKGGYKYHGVIMALANAARKSLEF